MRDSGGSRASSWNVPLFASAVVLAIAGAVLLAVGIGAFGQASDTRAGTARFEHAEPAIEARTQAATRDVDAPIGRAEKLATSVSATSAAGDAVLDSSNAADAALSRAVRLANAGDIGGAHQLYIGDALAAVQKLNDDLARARAALAAAQQSVADLRGTGP